MPQNESNPPLLTFSDTENSPLSIRAKALVFADPQSRRVLEDVERVAPSEAPVLIHGETGTGKELVARHVHRISGRRGPFLAVNCGAITENLAEAELFGHEAGAYTGAVGSRAGWFESAHGGTLFLDEIGDLPLALQVKLLRVLQEHEVVRVGARKATAIDVRLVAATNVDLAQAVSAGHFRQDLYYRLNVVSLTLPPLRARRGDILPLAEYFLGVYAQRLGLTVPQVGEAAVHALLHYPWPGNIRELENVIHFALLVSSGKTIEPRHLKLNGGIATSGAPSGPPLEVIAGELRRLFSAPGEHLFDDLEDLIVREAYRHARHNQVRSAELLGVTRNVLRTLLKRHGLLPELESAGK
ncbi:sigma-54 interaction domain-containing protein [Chitiniphilus eburneus]|uniref:Sigma-54-dependent Fis family transcriptional regulator n=1 Tax=Chitiniphilus eburneus TaxID=2571148 RepID=A0A4U0PP91_9NEIS|nr:sigma-54 dependent transcriptional regulator [Chitiniphilus eburneus]TJZ70061.1 sigma-54-dependent Fis family transcriptional regulator [Chitiniphilus eburneus]